MEIHLLHFGTVLAFPSHGILSTEGFKDSGKHITMRQAMNNIEPVNHATPGQLACSAEMTATAIHTANGFPLHLDLDAN